TVSTSSGSPSGNLPKKRGRKRKRPIEQLPTDRDDERNNGQDTMNDNVDYSDENHSDAQIRHSMGYDRSNYTNSHLYNSEGIRGYNPENGNGRSHYTNERRMN